MKEYKPLTPKLRLDINIAFNKQIEELKTCEPNAWVKMQIEGLRLGKRLINGLPDGFPLSFDK
jgi:hypothetical protein